MQLENNREKAILIGIESIDDFKWAEFRELVRAAGAEEVGKVIQVRERPDPAYFIGSGKAAYLAELVRETHADLIISIESLSPVQIRNLEKLTGVRVIDRTDLILDIFAQRAMTKEGKLQVELAQLSYLLPRIGGVFGAESRSGGGIGTRGPGETKLEINRRHIRNRLSELRQELAEVEKNRAVQRQRREKNGIPSIALVGYTNAGKSTLFNRLTESGVSAQNRLFDTLDPVTRKIKILNNQEAVLLDTVGFVSDLPHQLVAAFKATLEETVRATLLIHVMDVSNPELLKHYQAVQTVLSELNIETKSMMNVLNKIDQVEVGINLNRLVNEWSAIPISARTGAGIEELIAQIRLFFEPKVKNCSFHLPYSKAGLLERIHQKGKVKSVDYTDSGIIITAEMDELLLPAFRNLIIEE